jgi:hypothetical protein
MTPDKLDELDALLASLDAWSPDSPICREAAATIRAQAEEIAQLNVELQDWILRS